VNNNNNNEIQQGLTWPALTTGWCLKYGPVKYKNCVKLTQQNSGVYSSMLKQAKYIEQRLSNPDGST